ncbi:hypothetical protein [Streptomyces cavernae]|uniref:hypothetical protein n=1 Tax=Streptomyces cavernae TaxID=2259034 RepID=UPI000FEBA4BE|nr:hypothetical protein [Streptomyces cavernae]
MIKPGDELTATGPEADEPDSVGTEQVTGASSGQATKEPAVDVPYTFAMDSWGLTRNLGTCSVCFVRGEVPEPLRFRRLRNRPGHSDAVFATGASRIRFALNGEPDPGRR